MMKKERDIKENGADCNQQRSRKSKQTDSISKERDFDSKESKV